MTKDTNRALADVITLDGEVIPEVDGYEIFDPDAIWKRKKMKNFYAKNLRVPIFEGGKKVYANVRILRDIKKYCAEQLDLMWDEMKRF